MKKWLAVVLGLVILGAVVDADNDPLSSMPPDVAKIVAKLKAGGRPTPADLAKLRAWQRGLLRKHDLSTAPGAGIPVRVRITENYTIKSGDETTNVDVGGWADATLQATIHGDGNYFASVLDPNAATSAYRFLPANPGAPNGGGSAKSHTAGHSQTSTVVGQLTRARFGGLFVTTGRGDDLFATGGFDANLDGTSTETGDGYTHNEPVHDDEIRMLGGITAPFPDEQRHPWQAGQPAPVPRMKISAKALAAAVKSGTTQTVSGQEAFEWNDVGERVSGRSTIEITLRPPKASDVELVVDVPGYDRYAPKSGDDVVVTAALRAKRGAVPEDLAIMRVVWKLQGTSQEPGTAMNVPNAPRTTEKDFVLVAGSDGRPIGKDGQEVDVEAPENPHQSKVTLASKDWGGWTDLVVTADLSDGRQLTGKLATRAPGPIPLPDRDPGSKIAKAWKHDNHVEKLADGDDEEKTPEGKPTAPGDGFTLYEEYRGVQCGGAHVQLDPRKKDLFLRNKVGSGAKAGIGLLRNATQLEVHDCLTDGEMTEKRVMNANHREGAHLVDQHAIVILNAPAGGPEPKPADRFADRADTRAKAEQVGTPGNVEYVQIPDRGGFMTQLEYDVTVAHEILHSLGVEHHGTGDKEPTYWEVGPDGQLIERNDTAAAITVEDESGHVIAPTDPRIALLLSHPERNDNQALYLSVPHGEHSGDVNCLMHYAVAIYINHKPFSIYTDIERPNVRHVAFRAMPFGTGLCKHKTGTLNNDPKKGRLRWHGDAAIGDCAHKFVVSDRFPISEHTPSK